MRNRHRGEVRNMASETERLQEALKSRGQNPKYRIEVWFSLLTMLHSCLGLNREGETHPVCKDVLQILVIDIEEVIKSLS
jgi:hypothetical protein